jgi:winged helix-turn-helix DNA-binding protein
MPTARAPSSIYQTEWLAFALLLRELLRELCATLFPGVGLVDGFIHKILLLHIYVAQCKGKVLSLAELSREAGMSPSACRHHLNALIERGFIKRRGRVYVVVAWMPEADQRRALNRITATLTQTHNHLMLARGK